MPGTTSLEEMRLRYEKEATIGAARTRVAA
jgi:hypothetical protein